MPELREAIAEYISNARGIQVSAANVCVVPGGKPIIFFPMMALLQEGDEVIYPNPGFPIYESMIKVCGATPMPLVEERGFSFDLDVFKKSLSPRTKMVVLNSAHNPTGGTLPAEDIKVIADELRNRDVVVLSNEIYSRIVYGNEKPVSIATFPGMLEKTIILDGYSKTCAMRGWRMGYGVMPSFLVDPINKLMVNSNSCALVDVLFAKKTSVGRVATRHTKRGLWEIRRRIRALQLRQLLRESNACNRADQEMGEVGSKGWGCLICSRTPEEAHSVRSSLLQS